MVDLKDILLSPTVVGLALTIVALGLAIWQASAAHHQTVELTRISNALSTQYLGIFPEYFPQLSRLIESAKHEVLIACTLPVHGIFSNPDGWLSMKHALESALAPSHNIKIRCVFSDYLSQQARLIDQYKQAFTDWDSWLSHSDNTGRIRYFLEKFGNGMTIKELKPDIFIKLIMTASIDELKTTLIRAEIFQINYRPPVYMWIADSKEAIFAIPTTTPYFQAQAFWTTDARLISSLIHMHQEYYQQTRCDDLQETKEQI